MISQGFSGLEIKCSTATEASTTAALMLWRNAATVELGEAGPTPCAMERPDSHSPALPF